MILTVIAAYFVVMWLLPEGQITLRSTSFTQNGVFAAIVVGTVVGAIMSFVTEYFTAMGKSPVHLDRPTIVDRPRDQHHRRLVGRYEIDRHPDPDAGRRHHGFVLFCRTCTALRSQRPE